MAQRTCEQPECERVHVAKGLCAYHWRKANPPKADKPVTCPHCGAVTMRRDPKRRDVKVATGFCSLVCRDLWRIDTDINPAPVNAKRISRLPEEHPVMALIQRDAGRRTSKSLHRLAYEASDWPGLVSALRLLTVEVDSCWLWARPTERSGYGKLRLGSENWAAHRLMAKAARFGNLDEAMSVHHTCAERTCINPGHLQVIEPHLNTAEMVERQFYIRRIAALEAALADCQPNHPILTRGQVRVA